MRDDADGVLADQALDAIRYGIEHLSRSPFNCRKAYPGHNTHLRELIIAFGASGYAALFEIEPGDVVTVLAVRHQREDDFH